MASRTSKLASAFILSGAALLAGGCASVQQKPVDRVANGHKMKDCIFDNLDKQFSKAIAGLSTGKTAALSELGNPNTLVQKLIGYERICVAQVADVPLDSVPALDMSKDEAVVEAQGKALNDFVDRYVDQDVMGQDIEKDFGPFFEKQMEKAFTSQAGQINEGLKQLGEALESETRRLDAQKALTPK